MENNLLKDFDRKLKFDVVYKRAKMNIMVFDQEKGYFMQDKISEIFEKYLNNLKIDDKHIASDRLEFYYYNCESVKDYGWGCAWRCIQTILGTIRNYILMDERFENSLQKFNELINFDFTFEKLFLDFGAKETLLNLFLSCYKLNEIPKYLSEKDFAPHETENGWAEPFLAKLILHNFKIEGDLFLLNKYSDYSFAAQDVYDRTINYEEFKDYLLHHFKSEFKTPVMIDDGLYCLCIIGAYLNMEGLLTLLIADPHVEIDKDGSTGIYHVNLNEKGNFYKTLNDHPTLKGNRLNFENGFFMIYAPKL